MTAQARLYALGLCLGGFDLATAAAEEWPTRPVKFIVGQDPGGFVDQNARLLANQLQEQLHQPFVVENKPGATGTVGAQFVASQKPDGYNLLVCVDSLFTMTPHMQD